MSSPTPQPQPTVVMSFVSENEDTFQTLVRKVNEEVRKDVNSPVQSIQIQRMVRLANGEHLNLFSECGKEVALELGGNCNQKFLFLTSQHIDDIAKHGIDKQRDSVDGTFGNGIYLTESALNASRYAFASKSGCLLHQNSKCPTCIRKMIVCRVILGESWTSSMKINKDQLPQGHHSVKGLININSNPVYVLYDAYQIMPEYYVEFTTSFKARSSRPQQPINGNILSPSPRDNGHHNIRRGGTGSRYQNHQHQQQGGNAFAEFAGQFLGGMVKVLIDDLLDPRDSQGHPGRMRGTPAMDVDLWGNLPLFERWP